MICKVFTVLNLIYRETFVCLVGLLCSVAVMLSFLSYNSYINFFHISFFPSFNFPYYSFCYFLYFSVSLVLFLPWCVFTSLVLPPSLLASFLAFLRPVHCSYTRQEHKEWIIMESWNFSCPVYWIATSVCRVLQLQNGCNNGRHPAAFMAEYIQEFTPLRIEDTFESMLN